MSNTITIRIQDELADWLKETARKMGVSQGQLVREQLERRRDAGDQSARFMKLAGSVRLESDLSTRKGFSRE